MLAIHTTLARFVPEMEMDAKEAREIAAAYVDVATYYPVLSLPPKYMALLTFGSVVTTFYGFRLAAWRMRTFNEQGPRQRTHEVLNNALGGQPTPRPPQQNNGAGTPVELRRGTIVPGVEVEFPPDHPLVKGKPN